MSGAINLFWHLVDPLIFMSISASYLPTTISHLIATKQYHVFYSPSLFKDAWFAQFWSVIGPQTRENASVRVEPLLAQAHGVVLDIGPGNGEWVHRFDKSKITKILGVEPNTDHHAGLRKKIESAGLKGIYEIVPVGVEGLKDGKWVKEGEVDSVVTIQCLCSVPQPKKMMSELYELLKDGGMWIVYEHVITFPHQGSFLRWYQATIDLVWPQFLGGCSITKDTGRWLKESGAWTKVDLKQPEDEEQFNVVPHIMGVLTK